MTGKRKGSLVLAVLLLAYSVPAGAATTVVDDLVRIDGMLAAGQGSRALAEVDALLHAHGDDPLFGWQLRDRRGMALLLDDKPEAALPYLEETVRRSPLEPGAHRNLADALRRLGRRGRALSEYTQAVELAPLDPGLRLELAQYLVEFGQWRRAGNEFATAGTLGAGPLADQGLALALLKQGRADAAVAPLRRLYAAEPGAASRRSLAAALQAAGQDSQLVALLDAVPLAEMDRTEMLALVQSEGTLGGDPGHSLVFVAELDAGRAPPPVAAHALFWARVGLNLIAAEHWDAALVATGRAVDLEPENRVYRNNRLVVLQKLGQDDAAAREREAISRLGPASKGP